jgi:UDP-N-acetylmuramyl pentapeptide synthase
VEAFGHGGEWFKDVDALIDSARRSLKKDVAVLIKGSRANRLERVSAALTGAEGKDLHGEHGEHGDGKK